MINLLISLAAGILITFGVGAILGGAEYGIVPGLVVMIAAYILLARRTMKKVEVIMMQAQEHMKTQKVDKAIEVMKTAYPLGKMQFLVGSQIDGQIGSVLFMTKKFKQAEPYLKRSFKRSWTPRAMLGVLYYKRKKFDDMIEAFEKAASFNKKEALLWNLYSYCLWKAGKKDEAIGALTRALESLPEDEKTKVNLKALQNNKKMKMRGWNMMWYQFHLDSPPAQKQQHQFRRR